MEKVLTIVPGTLFISLLLLAIVLLNPWPPLSTATSVRRLTLSEVRDQAESVIVGVVTAISTRTSPDGKMAWTDYEIAVEETLAGEKRENPTIVSFAGGRDGPVSIGVAGMPQLTHGERYVLFLLPRNNFIAATVGWGQGIFHSVDVTTDSGRRTIFISYDGEPLQVNSEGQLFRGSPVQVKEGKLVSLPPQRPSTPQSTRMPDPVIYDAEGNVIPQVPPAAQIEEKVSPIAERRFATLDDLRSFLRKKKKERTVPGGPQ